MENALSAPPRTPADPTWPDQASLAAFRAWLQGMPTRAAVDRYLPDRRAAGASARSVIGLVKRQLVAFATSRAHADLAATLAASSPSDRKLAKAAAAAIETLRGMPPPQPLFGLLGLLHLYIGWRIAPQLPAAAAAALLAALAASALLIPWAMTRRRTPDRASADRWTWAGMSALGLFSMLLVLTLLRDIVLLLASPFMSTPLAEPTAMAVPLLALLGVVLGLVNARRTARVKNVDVPIAGLPMALHGFTIAQITDVHVGPTVKRPYVQAIVDAVNRLGVDAVAVTGDLVDGRVADLHADVAPLAQLRSRHGTFFVTGNHGYYSGVAEWMDRLRALGLRVLHNEHVVLDHDGADLVMAGVADFGAHHFDPSHRSDPQGALAGAPSSAGLKVLLAHQPRSALASADAGFDVQLSGHTHGGQFWPWNLFVRLQQPFTAGLHRLRSLWVYTSRGTGYWGPPLRLGTPSEITRLRFVAAVD